MRKKDIPQDRSKLESLTPELCYAKGDDGTYDTALSSGWKAKSEALDAAWDDISEELKEAQEAVRNGEKSPIYFFMKKELMDEAILASHVGMFKFRVKRHCKVSSFKKLNDTILTRYTSVFKITIDELKNYKG